MAVAPVVRFGRRLIVCHEPPRSFFCFLTVVDTNLNCLPNNFLVTDWAAGGCFDIEEDPVDPGWAPCFPRAGDNFRMQGLCWRPGRRARERNRSYCKQHEKKSF